MKPITAAFATLAIPERRGLRSSSASLISEIIAACEVMRNGLTKP